MSASVECHVVVIHRWRAEYVDYAAVLDHTAHRVSYVTTEVGRARVQDLAADVEIVRNTDDLAAVRRAVSALAQRHGAPRRIVALKEDDLLTAATLRAEWGCEGTRPDQALRFLDKLVMSEVVAACGLAVPALAAVESADAVRAFAAEHGWPVIVKPRIGSSSDGVARLRGPADADGIDYSERPMLVQVFNPHPIYHVDGVYLDGRLAAFRASRYVNTCLDFRTGEFLGSVEEDDPVIVSAVGDAAERFIGAFDTDPLVFHLEVFVGPVGAAGAPECTFLEVGARVGGSEIPFLWREVHGYDLMAAALKLQLGEPLNRPEPTDGEVAGWLLVPSPAQRPCRITEVTPMSGRIPGLYAEELLRRGEVLPLADAYYEHVGGRFRFRGTTSREVEAAIQAAAADFRVSAEPVEDVALKHVVLVDPYSPARGLPPAFLEAGYACVRLQSTAEVPVVYRGPLDLSGYVANVVHQGDIEATIRQLSGYQPVAVITGSELGVELADELSELMDLDSNGTKLSATRRDKFQMIEQVAAAGLRTPRQVHATDEAQLRAWHQEVGGRIVVKPLRSAAGDGVAFCDTPDQAAAALAAIMGRENIFSLPNDGVVAQEYLVGAEYIVNTVSRAGRHQHQVTDIWGSGRLSVNAITDLLVESVLLEPDAPGVEAMTEYAFAVLGALGIEFGPAHLEIKLTPGGPCLVEIGARISGGELPYFAAEAIGESQLDWTVDCYVRPERFDARCGTPYRLKRYFAWSALASPYRGTLASYRGLEQIEALESFRSLRTFVAPGGAIQPTVNDMTYPLTVTLHHESEGVLQRDLNTIRYLDGAGFYDVHHTEQNG